RKARRSGEGRRETDGAEGGGGKIAAQGTSDLLNEYVKFLSLERGLAKNTCEAYGSDVSQFLAYLGKRDPLKADHESLSDYVWHLKSEAGLEPASLFRKIEALKSFYAFQVAERKIPESPAESFRSPRMPKKLPRYLTK